MNVGDDPDLALSIPLSSLMEEFVCPICFNVITECTITPCGHNFCGGCIKECLNRKHSCPCCNAPATIPQLLKNHHHDRIVTIINREKEIASKAYFQRLMNPKANNPSNDSNSNNNPSNDQNNGVESISSPVEMLFQKYLKKSLHSFETYYKELEQNHTQMQQKLTKYYASRLTEAQNSYDAEVRKNADADSLAKKLSQIDLTKSEWQSRNQKLEQSFDNSIQLLKEGYETYLSNIAPAPNFIPLAISVVVPGREVQMKKVIVKVNENSYDVKSKLEKKLEELGNPLSKPFDPKKNFFIVRRGVKLDNEAENKDDISILDEFLPLTQYNVKQGDVFELQGEIHLKNDAPAACFTVTFKKDSGMKMDYFSCKDCKFNWICRPCADSCHKGHTLVDYIMDHPATWACCYCVKNKKCSLVKK